MPDFRIENRPLSDLKPWDRNPRRINDAAMARLVGSMSEHGYLVPVVWNERTGTLISGHQRVEAAQKLGWDIIPTVIVDVDEDRAAGAALALNAEFGTWRDDLLRDILEDMDKRKVDLDLMTALPVYQIEQTLAQRVAAMDRPKGPEAIGSLVPNIVTHAQDSTNDDGDGSGDHVTGSGAMMRTCPHCGGALP